MKTKGELDNDTLTALDSVTRRQPEEADRNGEQSQKTT